LGNWELIVFLCLDNRKDLILQKDCEWRLGEEMPGLQRAMKSYEAHLNVALSKF